MIKITVSVDAEQAIRQIEMSGHAGAGEYGEDIVCAAVSSQVISVENSLEHLLNAQKTVEVDEVSGGYLKLVTPKDNSMQKEHDAQLLLRHLVYALEVIQDSYPEYIKIKIQSSK